jgi:hypothetical protein
VPLPRRASAFRSTLLESRSPSAFSWPARYRFMGSAIPLHPSAITTAPKGAALESVDSDLLDPEVFPALATLTSLWATPRPAPGVTPPTELDHPQTTADFEYRPRRAVRPRLCGASHEVWSPSAYSGSWGLRTCAGLAFPDYDPSPGFRTLLTVCSPSVLPALFHAGSAHGVFPFRAFPSTAAVVPLGTRDPLAVCPSYSRRVSRSWLPGNVRVRPAQSLLHSRTPCHERPVFRASHRDGVRCLPRGVNHGAGPMLSWGFCLFRVSREPGLGRLLPVALLPCTWRHRLSERPRWKSSGDVQLRGRRRCFGVSLGPDADAAALTAASTLLRFSTSSPFSRIRLPTRPGSWFRLGIRATSPRSDDPSSGLWGLLPEPREEAVSVAEFVSSSAPVE